MTTEMFRFAHEPRARLPLLLWGVRNNDAQVVVDDVDVRVRFGWWELRTPRDNVVEVSVTGPYSLWRAVGVRVSLADRGITFGSTAAGGACLRVREPVQARIGRFTIPLRHPAVTVTVEDPAVLARLLGSSGV